VFLLDTHVWLWALEEDSRRLGRRTLKLIDQWSTRNLLRVSPLSAYEVARLHATGRLTLSRPLESWIDAATDPMRIRIVPLNMEMAVDAGVIGHRRVPDPIDRMLIATARILDATLVTCDRAVLAYAGESRAVRVHDAAK